MNALQYAKITLVQTVHALLPEPNAIRPQVVQLTCLLNALMVVVNGVQRYVLQVLSVLSGNHISVLMENAKVIPPIVELLRDVQLINHIDVLI